MVGLGVVRYAITPVSGSWIRPTSIGSAPVS
jgi:hypothetical protein